MKNQALTKQLQERNYTDGYLKPLAPELLVRACSINGNPSKLSTWHFHPKYAHRLEKHILSRLRDGTLTLATLHNLALYINSVKGDWILFIAGDRFMSNDSSFIYYSKRMPKEYVEHRNLVSLYEVLKKGADYSLQVQIRTKPTMISSHSHHAYRPDNVFLGNSQVTYRDDHITFGHRVLPHFFHRWYEYAMAVQQ